MRKFMAGMIAAAMCVQLCAAPALALGNQTDSNAPQETVTQETEAKTTEEETTEAKATETETTETEVSEAETTETEATEAEPSIRTEAEEVQEKTDEAEIALMDEENGAAVLAETSETASGTCGENVTWVLTGDGTLTISGTGEMEDYDYASNRLWYDYKESIYKVVIEEGVTSIGYCAFEYCSGLLEIMIPEGVTSIGDYAFNYCSGLPEITIPSSVTNIETSAFGGCSSLQAIFVEGGNKNYASVDGILYDADITELVDCPEGRVQKVTIPSSVTSIRHVAFSGCSGLTEITIPEGVTSIGSWAFDGCSGLKKITIPEGVTSIGYDAFWHCENLKDVYFRGDKPEIDNNSFFYRVTATVYYPSGNDTWADAIGQNYGGTLTWVAYDVETPDTITTSSTDEAISGLTTSNVTLTLPNGTEVDETVQKTLFEKAAEYDRTLEFDFYEGEELTYSWTFDGSTITDPAQTVEFQIIIDANNAEVTNLVDEGANQIDYRFLHDGALPGPVKIKLDTKNMVSADGLYLYYYNPETKALELISSDVPMEGKYAIFTLNHCSDYILSNTFIRSLIPNKSDDANANGNNTSNTGNTSNAGNTGTGANTATVSGRTGDPTPLTLLVVSLFSAMTAMGAVMYVRQKRR